MVRKSISFVAACAALLWSSAALADNALTFCDFSNVGAPNMGMAFVPDGKAETNTVVLSNDAASSAGAAWHTTKVATNGDFATHFRYRQNSSGTQDKWGQGFTFTFQNKGSDKLGSNGTGLGIDGIGNTVSVAFITTGGGQTGGVDNGQVQVLNGSSSQVVASANLPNASTLRTGPNGSLDVWVDYTVSDLRMKVYFAVTPAPKPSTPNLQAVLPDTLAMLVQGNSAFVGFTGSTGATLQAKQQILYWVLANTATLTDCTSCMTNAQCMSPGAPACQIPNGQTSGFCVQCTSNANCSGTSPLCQNNTCVQCSGNGPPSCTDPAKSVCLTGGAQSGACVQCSATSFSACTSTTPVCDDTAHACVQCNTNAECSGNTPFCSNHACVACQNDLAPSCTDPARPACQKTGPLAGSCTQCSDTNNTRCGGNTPTCKTSVGVCSCGDDLECNPGQICSSAATLPACTSGCRVPGGPDAGPPDGGGVDGGRGGGSCLSGESCLPTDGGPGVCTATLACVGLLLDGGSDCPSGTVCNITSGACVQCLNDGNCPGGQVCDLNTQTCNACAPGKTGNCTTSANGAVCKSNLVCGCATDSDCGSGNSGRVCDDTTKVCIAGCRKTGGSGCQGGRVCSSMGSEIGQCSAASADAGPPDTGMPDTGAADTGAPDTGMDATLDADATIADAGMPDTTVVDSTVVDSTILDSTTDTGSDAGSDTGVLAETSVDSGAIDTGADTSVVLDAEVDSGMVVAVDAGQDAPTDEDAMNGDDTGLLATVDAGALVPGANTSLEGGAGCSCRIVNESREDSKAGPWSLLMAAWMVATRRRASKVVRQ